MGQLNYIEARLLYRKENYEQGNAGGIEVMTPVLEDGNVDPMRFPMYIGWTKLQMNTGQQVQLNFKLSKATNLKEAIEAWGPAIDEAILEFETQQRRQAIMAAGNPNGRMAK